MNFQGRKKVAILMMIAILCMNLLPIKGGTGEVIITPMVETASAADAVPAADVTMTPGQFCMIVDSNVKKNGEVITILKDSSIGLGRYSNTGTPDGVPDTAEITWEPYDASVIKLNFSNKWTATLEIVGPGYSQLVAHVEYGGMSYRVDCQVHVPLVLHDTTTNITNDNFGLVSGLQSGDGDASRGLQLATSGDYSHYLVKLKYSKYQTGVVNGSVATSTGGGIFVKEPSLTWETKDPDVVTVDNNGIVTAVGAGSTEIIIKTTTSYDGSIDTLTVPVFVAPLGKDSSVPTDPLKQKFEITPPTNSFTIETNAKASSKLIWTVYEGDSVTGRVINLDKEKLMTVTLSNNSGNASFTDIKAGTYYITAKPSDKFSDTNRSKVKILEFKVVVGVFFNHTSITINVDDTYDILANSNLPSKDWYTFVSRNDIIASVTNGIILGKGSGSTVIDCNANLGTSGNKEITVKVIDGIGLNMNSATIYTGSTLQLVLNASSPVKPTWTSSDLSIATVTEDGLVTGVKPGDCEIVVRQVINGVTKKLTCKIRVIQTVTKITLDPTTTNIAVGDFVTINATVEPKLSNVKLNWVSSDTSVVEISQAGDLSATVKGVSGGVAVVSAINKDNVVVGSCLIYVYQPIDKIVLSETNVTLPLSTGWFQLYATIEPHAAKDQEIIWVSTDPSVIKVDSNGKVTLVKPGSASVIATSKVNATISAICNVTVTKSVTGIALDTTNKNMFVGETFRLTYTVKPSDSSNAAVTWTTSNSSVASVDKTGLISARAVGTAVILVKTTDGGFVATCTVTVGRTATAVKLDVTQLTLNVGDYYYLETTLTPADATEKTLTWETSDKKVVTVSKTGKVTAKSAGTCIIMVKTKSGSTGYCTIKVVQPVTGIQISSSEEHLVVGDELELTATLIPSNIDDGAVTWESNNEEVATVNKKGEVVAKRGGVAVISVTSEDGNYKDYCVVYVQEYVTSIKLNKTYYKLGLGKTFTLKATIGEKTATNKEVEWSSSDESIVTVNEKGVIKGLKLGTAVITCTATDGSDVETSCTVRVCRLVTSIDLDVNYITLVQGKSHTIKAKVNPSNATYKTPLYSVDKTDVAIVNKNGVVTGIKPGNAIVTVKANDSSGVKSILYVNVIAPVASTGVSVSESEVVMSPGETKTVIISIVPNNATDSYTWSSDNSLVASVDAKTGKITAKAIGTANITVMTESGRRGTIKVFVVGLSKTDIKLPQYTSTLINLQVDGAGTSSLKVRWDVDNQEVATVVNGRVTGKALGTTTVYAVVNGRTLTCKVTVTKIP